MTLDETPGSLDPYRLPRHVIPQRYELRLEPDLTTATFSGVVTIALTVTQATSVIILNAVDLTLSSATIKGAAGERFDAVIVDPPAFVKRRKELPQGEAAYRKLNQLALRVLAPGGLLMFSTFGPDTLKELRAAFSRVDQHPHVSRFVDLHDIGDILVKRGDSVKRGQVISKAGATGSVNAPQVHFELRRGSTPVDPTELLAGM